MKSIYVIITDCNAVSDLILDKWYQGVLTTPDYGYGEAEIKVSTGVMLDKLRLGVVRGEIKPFRIRCEVTGWESEIINEFGQFKDYTEYPFEISVNIITSILMESIEIRKQRRTEVGD